ncbi:MAG: PKD domain-containing protein, partial [Candidatus Thermoplasmatota archaeon]|nr:PKD domain-containing protein [Candidatus Thermoplasmatota archaeon]
MEHNVTATLIVLLLLSAGCLDFGGGDGGLGSNLNPQAVVTVASGQKVIELGSTIRLDASESLDEDGTITSYKWDFGDGNTGTSSIENH